MDLIDQGKYVAPPIISRKEWTQAERERAGAGLYHPPPRKSRRHRKRERAPAPIAAVRCRPSNRSGCSRGW